VLVGPGEETFVVHEHFICGKSKFFEAACRKEWKEGVQKLIRLPEVEPWIFKSYVSWVYTGNAVIELDDETSEEQAPRAKQQDGFIKLYVLGDTLDDMPLRNRAMKEMVSIDCQPGTASVAWAFDHTPTGSLLRSMLVNYAALRWSRETFANESAQNHPEFVQELAKFLMNQTANSLITFPKFVEKLPAFIEVPKTGKLTT